MTRLCTNCIMYFTLALTLYVFITTPPCFAETIPIQGLMEDGEDHTFTSPTAMLQLRMIPSGVFVMGSSAAEIEAYRVADSYFAEDEDYRKRFGVAEQPRHKVKISNPFYLGIYEVTQSQYELVIGKNPSSFCRNGDQSRRVTDRETSPFPVEQVTWFDAIEFCIRLSERDKLPPYYDLKNVVRRKDWITSADVSIQGGIGYRLPTEAEWEYACRAGTTSPFEFGDSLNGDKANVDGKFPFGNKKPRQFLDRTTAVGSYLPNGFGLYDMHGNVFEWCQDDFDVDAYKSRTDLVVDPAVVNGAKARVARGGCYFYCAGRSRSAFRQKLAPDAMVRILGFRIAKNVR